MNTVVGQGYMAFISYRHADNTEEDQQWATWLHHQLEIYNVPEDLIGTINLRGESIPDRIYPVFRDEVSLSADANLSTAIAHALDHSQFLIVLCSPRAVQSQYVNEEILHFKRIGKQDRIMAALILGEPNVSLDTQKVQDPEHASTLECFPRALQHPLTVDGHLDPSRVIEPIAANFRLPDGGKGITNPNVYKQKLLRKGFPKAKAQSLANSYEEQINNARLKIIAGILGVPLERLTQRDKLYQLNKARAETRRFRYIAGSMFLLTLSTGVAGLLAWQGKQEAGRNFSEARQTVDSFVYEISRKELADIPGLQELRETFARRAIAQYADFIKRNPHNIEVQIGYANAKVTLGGILGQIGSMHAAEREMREAVTLLEEGSKYYPEESRYKLELAKHRIELGSLYWMVQQPQEASPFVRHAVQELQSLPSERQQDPEAVFILARAYNTRGNLNRETNVAQEAENDYKMCIELATRIKDIYIDKKSALKLISAALHNLSLIYSGEKKYIKSLEALEESDQLLRQAPSFNPNAPSFLDGYVILLTNKAKLFHKMEKPKEARETFEEALKINKELVVSNPRVTNYNWQLAETLKSYAWFLSSVGDYESSLKNYEDAASLMEDITQHIDDRPYYGVAFVEVLMALADFHQGGKEGIPADDQAWRTALDKMLETAQRVAEKYPKAITVNFELSKALKNRGLYEESAGRENYASALGYYMQALKVYSEHSYKGDEPPTSSQISDFLNIAEIAIQAASRVGSADEARKIYDLAYRIGKTHIAMAGVRSLGGISGIYGGVMQRAGHLDEAIQAYRRQSEIAGVAWKRAEWNWWLRQQYGGASMHLGQLFQQTNNIPDEVRARQDHLRIWVGPMQGIAVQEYLDLDPSAIKSEDLQKLREVSSKDYGMKRFTVPANFGGLTFPFQVYITNVLWPNDPLGGQARWIEEERDGKIPKEIIDSFKKLHDIAHENNVSFMDLTVYAMGKK